MGWLNWTLVLANLLIAALLIWQMALGLAGDRGSRPDMGSGLVGEEQAQIQVGPEGSSGEAQTGGQEGQPEGQQIGPEGQETQPGGQTVSGTQVRPPEQAQAGTEEPRVPSLASYNGKLRKDLFGLGPADEPAPAIGAADPQPSDLKLQGVILGEPPQAIIYDTRRGTTHVVTLDDRIGEITIEEIGEDTVVLSFGGESFDLKL